MMEKVAKKILKKKSKKTSKKKSKKKFTKKSKKKVVKKPTKVFMLTWCFESFAEEESFFTKRMFGGLAVYVHGLMVMLLSEKPGDREWAGCKFPFDIWNGILLPTFKEHHESLQKEFPQLVQHPLLKKWLYLPVCSKGFESVALEISEKISGNDPRFGIVPNIKKKLKKESSKTKVTTKG